MLKCLEIKGGHTVSADRIRALAVLVAVAVLCFVLWAVPWAFSRSLKTPRFERIEAPGNR